MSQARVYFADARSEGANDSLVEKTKLLFDAAGLQDCIKKGDKVALRVHFGEFGNTRYLRPALVRAVADKVKEVGGEPFIAETLTIHAGPWASRTTADDLLRTAAKNGFTIGTLGCPIVPSDGWFGTDDVRVSVKGHILREAYVAKAFAMCDAMIVIGHVTFSAAVVTCALKKVGVGCLSKKGKYLVHFESNKYPHVSVRPEECPGKKCQWSSLCQAICPHDALRITDRGPVVNRDLCRICALCIWVCACCAKPLGLRALYHPREEPEFLVPKIADAASAVLSTFRREKVGFLGYMLDITRKCDCFPSSQVRVIDDLGILAGRDPVAVDAAAIDQIYGKMKEQRVYGATTDFPPKSFSHLLVQKAAELGLGRREYALVKVQSHDRRAIPSTFSYVKRMYDEKPHIIEEVGL